MRLLAIFALVLLVAGCPRDQVIYRSPEDVEPLNYAWQQVQQPVADTPQQASPADVEIPDQPRPAFSEQDTFDTSLLPGRWLQAVGASPVEVKLGSLEDMDIVEFSADGKLSWHFIIDGEDSVGYGRWEKQQPGWITFTMDNNPPGELSIEFFGNDMFFFWSDFDRVGYWFIRIPDSPQPAIKFNTFETDYGLLKITTVVGNSFEGSVQGQQERMITGLYKYGIMLIRWDEPATNTSGYAAFRMSGDWSAFEGAWWLANYQAAPFGGKWDGRHVAAGDGDLPTGGGADTGQN